MKHFSAFELSQASIYRSKRLYNFLVAEVLIQHFGGLNIGPCFSCFILIHVHEQ